MAEGVPTVAEKANTQPTRPEVVINKDQVINRQGKDFVLYAGLLDAAHKAGLQAIGTTLLESPSSANGQTAIVHAEVILPWGHFSGIGDANAGNVGRMIAPHIIRMAETRAKARAFRDALNIGMAALEELGPDPDEEPARPTVRQQDRDTGTAARRPVQATATSRGQRTSADVQEDEVREQYNRLATTADRLGIEYTPGEDLKTVDEVMAERNALLSKVNDAVSQRRSQN